MTAETMATTARAVRVGLRPPPDHLELGQEPGGEGHAGLGQQQHREASRQPGWRRASPR